MGYACPVCERPQADGEHLANHLAFAAMLHGDAHEAWLDERVPGWADRKPDELAAAVVEHAEETDDETVFDEGAGGRPDVDVGHAPDHARRHDRAGSLGELDPEVRRIVEEAVEMTRERHSGGEDERSEDAEE